MTAASAPSHSQTAPAYPAKPVRIVVGFPAGSGTDMLARFVGGKFTDRVGQQVVVDNRPGANGIIAAELTAKAPPDGYTLQFMSTSHTMNAAVYKLPFDPVKSFTPVMQLGSGPARARRQPRVPRQQRQRADRHRHRETQHGHVCRIRHGRRQSFCGRAFFAHHLHAVDQRPVQKAARRR